jgi:DNA repair photolyase
MRWDELRLDGGEGPEAPGGRAPLLPRGAVTRTFDTPEFRGITFHEVTARSALNKVPEASRMPFRWTINPYRGCSHACLYCAWGETPILMGDGRTRRLQDLSVGDVVYGTERRGSFRRYVRTEVLAHWRTEKPAYRVRLADGTTLVTSGDHRFLTERGWKHVTGAMSGLEQRPYLTTNNSLLGFGAMPEPPKVDDAYRQGYLTGMIRGDGTVGAYAYPRGNRKGMISAFRLALVDHEALDRSRDFLAELGVRTSTRVFSAATAVRREVTSISTASSDGVQRVLDVIAWPAMPERQWYLGFAAGIFDAEGSHSGGVLRIANTSDELIGWTCDALEEIGVPHVVEDRHLANRLRTVRVTGGLVQRMRFLQSCNPAITRKRDLEGFAIKTNARLDVVSVEDLGLTLPMYDITTGTGDFIANGVVSHNCFARKTHEYLDLDSGHDFDSQIVVKTNVAELVRRELAKPSWQGEHVAMGTNVDCYQRAEGRYRLMPGIIEALRDAANPFSILTKGALILRDIPLLVQAAEVTDVSAAVSVGFLDEEVWRRVEPGTPPPQRRLDVVRRLTDAGIPTGVLMAPVLPFLTDSPEQLEATVAAVAASGATHVSPISLHLRPGAREWWQAWLVRERPDLVQRYAELYGTRTYAPPAYSEKIAALVRRFATAHGVGRENVTRWRTGHERARLTTPADTAVHDEPVTQLTLL